MKWYEIAIDILFKVLIAGVIIAGLIFGYDYLKDKAKTTLHAFENQESQLEELYQNDVFFLKFMKEIREFQLMVASMLKASLERQDKINDMQREFNKQLTEALRQVDANDRKPSYEYLASVSVFILQIASEMDGKIEGAVGSGTIIANKNGYFYILTNKHVCDNINEGTCFIVTGESREDWVKMEFVKRTETEFDLSLWRVTNTLKGKRAINGLSIAHPQDKVFSVGNYLGNPLVYTEGTMAGYSDEYAMFNLPCAPGCSGSGVFNQDGNLISVIFAGNGVPLLGIPFGASMDTSKALTINGDVVELFLKEFFHE